MAKRRVKKKGRQKRVPKKAARRGLSGSVTHRLLRAMGGKPGYCGCVKPGARPPANIKQLLLSAIEASSTEPDNKKISDLINAGNPIWEAAIQCMHYGQFNTDQLTPQPGYFETNGDTVGGFVECIRCCYGNSCSS